MSSSTLSKFLVLFSLSLCSCTQPSIPTRPEAIKLSESSFNIPQIDRFTTANGLEVYLIEDHELPLLSGEFYFKFGGLTEGSLPKGQIDALMSQLRAGGIAGSTPQSLDEELNSVGASIEGAAGSEFSSLSFSSHKSDAELVFSKISSLVTNPAFDKTRLNIWKAQAIDSIDRRREDPEIIASATFSVALYGSDSIYSKMPTKDSIRGITSEKLRALSRRKILPAGTVLAVTGDITRKQLEELLDKFLSSWLGRPESVEVSSPPKYEPKPGVYFVSSSFEQSAVVIGQLGPKRKSADQYAMSVFNRYFGRGGFGSVLFTEVRSKRGFAYSVDGGFNPSSKTGEFSIDMGTRAEITEAAVSEAIRQINIARNQIPPEDQINDVKAAVQQGFIFNFAKPSSALAREVTLNLLGYPPDFNQTYLTNITSVTPEEVRQCAFNHLHPEKLIIVVVGKLDGKKLAKSLNLPFYPVKFSSYPIVLK